MICTSLLVSIALNSAPTPPREFHDYLSLTDKSYTYQLSRSDNGTMEIDLTSQTWHGIVWKHTMLVRQPSKVRYPGTGILYITGDGPRPGDLRDIALMTESTGMPTAMLFNIPNQPLFGGLKEDQIIALTMQRYLETKDGTWPLLFPMAKSALRAMDAVESVTKSTPNPIHRFVVTGASKRGWTTWFVGAARDKRVIGIAPMVIDNLNVSAQMKHQIESWGKYSEQIEDYTRLGLQAKLATPDGQHLSQIVDPFTYRRDIKVPTLIVKGSNDPYWTVDALDLYYKELKQPKWVLNVPNAGHGLNGGVQAIMSIGAFARTLAGDGKMPKFEAQMHADGRTVSVKFPRFSPAPMKVTAWVGESSSFDFRGSKYYQAAQADGTNAMRGMSVPLSVGVNSAVFLEARYKDGSREFTLSSPTKVFPK